MAPGIGQRIPGVLREWPAGAIRAGVVVCVLVAALGGLARLDETLGLFDWRADRNASLTYLDREYGDRGWALDRRVIEDARLWMPRDAEYGIVLGPRWDNLDGQVAADFLKYFLLPAARGGPRLGALGLLLRLRHLRAGRRLRGSVRGAATESLRAGAAMTLRAIAGLFVLHLFFLGVGAGILWGLRGWRRGSSSCASPASRISSGSPRSWSCLTLSLVLGLPFGPPLVLACGIALVAGGILLGRRRAGDCLRCARPPGASRAPSVVSAVFIAAVVVYFEAFFRSSGSRSSTTGTRGSRGR